MRIVAYAYNADVHCPDCTLYAQRAGILKRDPDDGPSYRDEHGIELAACDSEGNSIGAITDFDEHPDDGLFCGTCRKELVEPRAREWSFDRFTVSMPQACLRDCTRPGSCDEAVEHWLDRCGTDWSSIDPDDIRAELREYGAWDENDLKDDEQNKRRILWIAAGNIRDEQ